MAVFATLVARLRADTEEFDAKVARSSGNIRQLNIALNTLRGAGYIAAPVAILTAVGSIVKDVDEAMMRMAKSGTTWADEIERGSGLLSRLYQGTVGTGEFFGKLFGKYAGDIKMLQMLREFMEAMPFKEFEWAAEFIPRESTDEWVIQAEHIKALERQAAQAQAVALISKAVDKHRDALDKLRIAQAATDDVDKVKALVALEGQRRDIEEQRAIIQKQFAVVGQARMGNIDDELAALDAQLAAYEAIYRVTLDKIAADRKAALERENEREAIENEAIAIREMLAASEADWQEALENESVAIDAIIEMTQKEAALKESLATPWERMRDAIIEAREVLGEGEWFDRARRKAIREFAQTVSGIAGGGSAQEALLRPAMGLGTGRGDLQGQMADSLKAIQEHTAEMVGVWSAN